MSALLDSLCGSARLAECAKTDEPASTLREYIVQIKYGACVRDCFEVMAYSKTAAQKALECLCEEGEQVIALTLEEAEERGVFPESVWLQADRENNADKASKRAQQDYQAALNLQINDPANWRANGWM